MTHNISHGIIFFVVCIIVTNKQLYKHTKNRQLVFFFINYFYLHIMTFLKMLAMNVSFFFKWACS